MEYNFRKKLTCKTAFKNWHLQHLLHTVCQVLSHAVVERIISHVTDVKTKLRNILSTSPLAAITRVKTRLNFSGKCCENFQVTKNAKLVQ